MEGVSLTVKIKSQYVLNSNNLILININYQFIN